MTRNSRKPISKGRRQVETREPKVAATPCVVFSLKHLIDVDDVGQSLEDWAKGDSKLLLGLLQKMSHISKQTAADARQDPTLTIYGEFPAPDKTDFKCPPSLKEQQNWGVIRNIGGQKARAAGFFRDNVFHVVFLDKEHKFWKSEK